MRVAIGGISHESSTFTNVATTLDSFRERSYLHGAAIVELWVCLMLSPKFPTDMDETRHR